MANLRSYTYENPGNITRHTIFQDMMRQRNEFTTFEFDRNSGQSMLTNPNKDVKLLSTNPLTKISDTEYVEGYWCVSDKYDLTFNRTNFPWPKSEETADTEF